MFKKKVLKMRIPLSARRLHLIFVFTLLSIGVISFGASPANAATLVVTTGTNSGAGSLREALSNAVNGDTITFASNVTDITLTSALPTVTVGLTITGPGADILTIHRDASAASFRVFAFAPGASQTVTISGVKISGGDATPGGGIGFNGSTGSKLNLSKVSVVDNNSGYGGGIDATGNQGSSVLIDSSTISGNTTNGGVSCGYCNGAGMKAEVPTTIINSTFSGNRAGDNGGGIKVDSNVTIINSTFANNSANGEGGGIWVTRFSQFPNLVLKNTLIAGNTYGSNKHQCDVSQNNTTLSVNLNNLIEDGSCNFLWGSGVSTGSPTNFLSGNPSLLPLASNGGSTQTHGLGSSSIALGAGDASTCADVRLQGVDQQGTARSALCSIGSFEVAIVPATTTTTTTPVTTTSAPTPVSLPATGKSVSPLILSFLFLIIGLVLVLRRRVVSFK